MILAMSSMSLVSDNEPYKTIDLDAKHIDLQYSVFVHSDYIESNGHEKIGC